MSMKKGFCIKCHTTDERKRIFPVNSESAKCFCPRCMAEYKPKDAINYYNHFIRILCKRSDRYLRVAKRPDLSYDKFGHILEYEPELPKALIGRLTSLFYLSTLRRARFEDVITIASLDSDRYHLVGAHDDYFNFLMTSNADLELYRARIYKMLTIKSYFFDMDCLKLYISRIREMILYKKYVIKELTEIGNEKEASDVEKEIEELNNRLNEHAYYTADGFVHRFKGFEANGAIKFLDSQESVDVSLRKYRPSSLDGDNKGTILIKDQVFRTNKGAYNTSIAGFIFGVFSSLVGIGLLITALFTEKTPAIIFLSVGVFFTLLGGGLILWSFLFRKYLTNRSY